jgi:hypothetical protein
MRTHGPVVFLFAAALAAQLPPQVANRPQVGCHVIAIGLDGNFAGTTWNGGNVPFTYDANVTAAMQTVMAAAMLEITSVVNVHFVPRTTETDYLVIRDSTINSSVVGRIGGPQLANVFNWNVRFEVVHVLMHVLGYWHEHQRPDRDQYVAVQTANVDPTRITDFDIVPTGVTRGRPYDFDSVMHFAGTEGGIGGAITLLVLPPNTNLQNSIGQRTHLSTGDVDALRLVYGSSVPPTLGSLSPAAVPAWLPGTLLVNGTLLDEVTRVWLDGAASLAFTTVSAAQLRVTVPNMFPIGAHTVQVESAIGRSNSLPFQVTGNDPPVLEVPSILVRNFATLFRVHSDNVRTNILLVAFDNQPSTIPGVISLGLGSQFTTLGQLATGIGGPTGVLVVSVTVPTSVPTSTNLWFQSIVFDPSNLTVPITTSQLAQVRTF